MEVGEIVADGLDRVCEEVSAGFETPVEEVTAAAAFPVPTKLELDPPPLPSVWLLSLAIDVLEGPCPPKTVVAGTTVVVLISKYVVGATIPGPIDNMGVTNPEVIVVVSSTGNQVPIKMHPVVVGQIDPPGSSGPGVIFTPGEVEVAVGAGVTDGEKVAWAIPGIRVRVCSLVVSGTRNVEVVMTLSVDNSTNVPCWMGIIDGGSGFGGTSERSGPSSGQNVMCILAFWTVDDIVYRASVLYYSRN